MVHGMPETDATGISSSMISDQQQTNAGPAAGSDDNLPRKRILTQAHLKAFQESETYKNLVDFVEELNTAIIGKKLSSVTESSIVGNHCELEKDHY